MGTQPPRKDRKLVTHLECLAFKQSIDKELTESRAQTHRAIDRLGPEKMNAPNRYLHFFKKEGAEQVPTEHQWGCDRVKDDTTYDQHVPRDTYHVRHTEASRKQCKVSLQTAWKLRSSQAYGWLPPIDDPSYGYGRTSFFKDNALDKSHLQVGGPWTAR
eukprot:TRINITY_DN43803_c0_g1_i1.p1 TRINITY_DN43803_c0_g1~~TRINITY_DN43803_c0_g1_i1.p1  ORF type:complete len:159 (-),score=22.32 TRINITY_DN43803_c0_g1_i1:74-550(-)